MSLLTLKRGAQHGLLIRPRWPARELCVDERVLTKLCAIQASLPARMTLILTRGYEARSSGLGFARKGFRALGIRVFCWLYPGRRQEIGEIFGANGHDIDGTHIDISLRVNGRRQRLLPLGVFTPPFWQRRRVRRCAPALALMRLALQGEGFRLHRNATESLQMHCDLPVD